MSEEPQATRRITFSGSPEELEYLLKCLEEEGLDVDLLPDVKTVDDL